MCISAHTATAEAAGIFLASLDTPRALTACIMLRYGELSQLAKLKADARFVPPVVLNGEPESVRFKLDYQASELCRKTKWETADAMTARHRARRTLVKWARSEKQCYMTNVRFNNLIPMFEENTMPGVSDMRLRGLLLGIRKDIARLLGPVPEWDKLRPAFGPGAVYESSKIKSDDLTVLDKLDRLCPAVTRECLPVFEPLYRETLWSGPHKGWVRFDQLLLVPGNRWGVVPKDFARDRPIGVEPGGNVWLQKAVGSHLRGLLQRQWKLLLPDGESERLHHRLSCEGSQTGAWATIDLESASDTIAREVVRVLLPDEWYSFLDKLRTTKTSVNHGSFRGWCHLEKFSSMGNGFTFELETLIFAAIARSLVSSGYAGKRNPRVSVYGDDIIVPSNRANDVIAALKFFGFKTNPRKTFVSGPFRESCGGDFYHGRDVTPWRITNLLSTPQAMVSAANGVHSRWNVELSVPGLRKSPGRAVWLHIRSKIPRTWLKCQVPASYGDVGLHFNDPRPAAILPDGQKVWWLLHTEVHRPAFDRYGDEAWLAYALLGGTPEGPVPRGDRWRGKISPRRSDRDVKRQLRRFPHPFALQKDPISDPVARWKETVSAPYGVRYEFL